MVKHVVSRGHTQVPYPKAKRCLFLENPNSLCPITDNLFGSFRNRWNVNSLFKKWFSNAKVKLPLHLNGRNKTLYPLSLYWWNIQPLRTFPLRTEKGSKDPDEIIPTCWGFLYLKYKIHKGECYRYQWYKYHKLLAVIQIRGYKCDRQWHTYAYRHRCILTANKLELHRDILEREKGEQERAERRRKEQKQQKCMLI